MPPRGASAADGHGGRLPTSRPLRARFGRQGLPCHRKFRSDGECGRHDFLISAGSRLPGSIRRCGGTMTPRSTPTGWSSSLGSVSLGSVAPASLRPDEKPRGLTARQFPRGGGMDPGIARPLAKNASRSVRPCARAVAAIRPSTSRRGSGTSRFPKRSQPSLSTTRTRTAKRFGMPSGQPSGASADLGSRRGRAAIRRS